MYDGREEMISKFGEQYVVDKQGKPVSVLLNMRAYHKILDELEELAAIRAYDAAKASKEKSIPFEQAIAEIERARK